MYLCLTSIILFCLLLLFRFIHVHASEYMCLHIYLHRGVFACVTDWSTPFYLVGFSWVANTQALLIYLKLISLNLYYSKMSGCQPPLTLFAVLIPLLQWFHPPLQGLLPCYDFWTVSFSLFPWMLLHEPFFWTFSLGRQGISRVSQSVSVFPTFKLFVPRNRNSKKICTPSEVVCLRRRHPPELWFDVTRCPVGTGRQDRTRWNALALDIDVLQFLWGSDHYVGCCGLSPDIPPRRGATLPPFSRSAVKTAPIAQARPNAYIFMPSHKVDSGGRASRAVSYLGSIS